MENKLITTLTSSLIATIVFGIVIFLMNNSITYQELIIFFVVYFVVFFASLKFIKNQK